MASQLKIRRKSPKSRYIVIATILLALICAGVYLYIMLRPSNEALYGSDQTNPTSKIPTSSTDSTGSISNSKKSPQATTETPTPDTGVAPRSPSGVFVSHHKPNLSGNPISNTLSSTCTTTPGAYCTIQFSNESTTRELPEKQADSDGNVFWTWSLQDIGLTAGKWNVASVARNGNLKSTSTDAIPLTIED